MSRILTNAGNANYMIKRTAYELFSKSVDNCILDNELLSFAVDTVLKNKDRIPLLYRYSPADYYNIRGLEKQSLYLSSVGSMNDIFEGLSCEVNDRVLRNLRSFSKCAYLKSFSEEKENLLMWAHYADGYKGICVEYDFSKLDEDILCHLFPVYYSDTKRKSSWLEYTINELEAIQRANVEMFYPDDTDFLKDIMHLFLIKSYVWNYEKEWRIVSTYPQIFNNSEETDDADVDAFYRIKSQSILVSGCIKAIYLGPQMEKEKREHIIEICSKIRPTIQVYSAKLSKSKYGLEFQAVPDIRA